jgi:twitching motility protein PilT
MEVKAPRLQPDDTKDIAKILIGPRIQKLDIETLTEFDTSYAISGIGRFRVNVYRQRGSFAIVLRSIPFVIPTFKDLGLPPVLEKISQSLRVQII